MMRGPRGPTSLESSIRKEFDDKNGKNITICCPVSYFYNYRT